MKMPVILQENTSLTHKNKILFVDITIFLSYFGITLCLDVCMMYVICFEPCRELCHIVMYIVIPSLFSFFSFTNMTAHPAHCWKMSTSDLTGIYACWWITFGFERDSSYDACYFLFDDSNMKVKGILFSNHFLQKHESIPKGSSIKLKTFFLQYKFLLFHIYWLYMMCWFNSPIVLLYTMSASGLAICSSFLLTILISEL